MKFKLIEIIENQFIKRLENEAKKCNTFEEFKFDFLIQLKHGTYYHITNDPNFYIDTKKGPRDMSSMAHGEMAKGKLMITSDLNYWLSYYKDRNYVVVIDMSNVPRKYYNQTKRGFGNEFFVDHPEDIIILKILNRNIAKSFNRRYIMSMPKNEKELLTIYKKVKGIK